MEELKGGRRRKAPDKSAELLFEKSFALVFPDLAREMVTQHRFALELKRQWRWDFAWPSRFLAVEIQGGVWTRGAHGHPSDIVRNMEKHNDAALLGWRWLQFTPKEVRSGQAVAFTRLVLMGYRP